MLIIISTALTAEEPSSVKHSVSEFFPGLISPPAVDLALPEDFIVDTFEKRINNDIKMSGPVLWGTKEQIEAFHEHKDLTQPIIIVSLSSKVAQIGPNSFSIEKSLSESPKRRPFSMDKYMWGDYPILVLRVLKDNKLYQSAYIGLNMEGGHAAFLAIITPASENDTLDTPCPVWDNLIKNTKLLTEQEMLKIHGYELLEGITTYEMVGEKIKVTAEKDINGKHQLAVFILTDGVKIKDIGDAFIGFKGGEWKKGEYLVKLPITLEINNKYSIVNQCIIPILLKTVDQFSVPTSELKHDSNVLVQEIDLDFDRLSE